MHSTNTDLTRSGEVFLPKDHLHLSVDPQDVDTPDYWVPRDPKLIRLTGRHPFNCEPPLHSLYDQGFISPISLHYVRSHGRVPKLNWETHKVKVCGLVANPQEFSMDEIEAMPRVTMPVTLTCAGNRRKEENMIRKTRGFNWGACATSTSVWTGVRLTHFLNICGIDMNKALHVRFSGTDKEGLKPGKFGSSVDISTAMSSFSDIIVAYEQNGKRFHPDHGYPVRIIIPGWVGARMVKWLDTIEVSEKVSDSHYHHFDNRIFPSFVDNKIADEEGYWYKEEYVFNQLNVNSVVVHPRDSAEVMVVPDGSYTVSGYGYSGGGRKITRVELSLDGGKTWRLTNLSFPEEDYSHAPKRGFYYCWMFWSLDVPFQDLIEASDNSGEMRVRAWDTSNNTQPADIIWNLMGYGNNCQYVVKMPLPPAEDGKLSAANAATSPAVRSRREPQGAEYTIEEVSKHNSRSSAWIIVNGVVYDTTKYLDEHPGGAAAILLYAGQDCTAEFLDVHSAEAVKMLEDYRIGVVADGNINSRENAAQELAERALKKDDWLEFALKKDDWFEFALKKDEWIALELFSRTSISPNTRLFTFKLQNDNQVLGLPVGGHVLARASIDGRQVMRAYTPTSTDDEKGYFTLVVKVYNPTAKFPQGGKMSLFMDSLQVGDKMKFTGPLGHVEYKGRGVFVINNEERRFENVALVCGGTGITPAFQIMKSACKDLGDTTKFSLIFGNKTEEDILLRTELDEMVTNFPEKIRVRYTIGQGNEGWRQSVGRVDKQMMRTYLPAAANSTLLLTCGPPPMMIKTVIPNALALGYDSKNIFKL